MYEMIFFRKIEILDSNSVTCIKWHWPLPGKFRTWYFRALTGNIFVKVGNSGLELVTLEKKGKIWEILGEFSKC